jgi:MinD-like ATPase involved in chromosome partitioning or flagellar assembly
VKTTILFDNVIPRIEEILLNHKTQIKTPVTIVRQANGTVTVVVKAFADNEAARQIANVLNNDLGPYSPGINSVILSEKDLIDPEEVLSSQDRISLPDAKLEIYLVDRLLTNQDWLRDSHWKPPVPIAVAYSIKGGVGRSLALTVFARYLAKMGKKVALVDLDLEAPGLGILLAADGAKYGVTDWLVEALVNNAPEILTNDFWFRVPALSEGTGAVFCVPAWGTETKEYIAKIGRAYLTSLSSGGDTWKSLGENLQNLVNSISRAEFAPDVVLIDSRAGLHDLGAATITQLGAEVMLFTRDEMQSWKGYAKLFEHLAKSRQIVWGRQSDDLRSRLKMVAAQIGSTDESLKHCVRSSYDIWQEIYDEEIVTAESDVTYAENDEAAPHYPTPIYFGDSLRGFPGWGLGDTIREEVINVAFGEFCKLYSSRLGFGGD